MHSRFGYVRVTCAVPRVSVGDPEANSNEILSILAKTRDADIVVFPELCVSGYSCADLFHQRQLLDSTLVQIEHIARCMPNPRQLVVLGAPVARHGALYNCAIVLNEGKVIGVAPKQFIPNYKEFYEARWFAAGEPGMQGEVDLWTQRAPFGTQMLFCCGGEQGADSLVVFAEICEAIWMPIPPSSLASVAGANIILNLSASNETIGKADYRRNLVIGQSGRCITGYAYVSSGPTESTNDVVFGGHALIAEGGHILEQSRRVGDQQPLERDSYWVSSDIDIQKLETERRITTSYNDATRVMRYPEYLRVPFVVDKNPDRALSRPVEAMPFVPQDPQSLQQRCAEVFGIQTAALAKRLECLGRNPVACIGISGGLDSTLALLVAARTFDLLGLPRQNIQAYTMPGFGTSGKTLTNARDLMSHLGVSAREIDIREGALQEFRELAQVNGYRPFGEIELSDDMSVDQFVAAIASLPHEKLQDLTFENVQARRRTELLMNSGFVLGTGDMSELWLGWCTYNADHQSMYNVNCGVPKTLVRFLVDYVARNEFDDSIRDTLLSIVNTEISPELLPASADGEISQRTEDTVGPYELHDFFMYHFVRNGFTPEKILDLALRAEGFSETYTPEVVKKWLGVNIRRAFQQQYKRDDVPNGPKVGSVSLSPRGDWRMPSDASAAAWLKDLD